jgi:hypothetical protein
MGTGAGTREKRQTPAGHVCDPLRPTPIYMLCAPAPIGSYSKPIATLLTRGQFYFQLEYLPIHNRLQ